MSVFRLERVLQINNHIFIKLLLNVTLHETPVPVYQTARYHNPDDHILYTYVVCVTVQSL